MSFFDGSNDDTKVVENLGPIPDGDHMVIVQKCEQASSAHNPSVLMFKLELECVQGPYEGKQIFANFIYQHHNPKAVAIGRARMKLLCVAATGSDKLADPSELYSKPFFIRTKQKKSKDGNVSVEIEKYGPKEGIPAEQQAAAAKPGSTFTQPPGATPADGVPF